MNIRYKDILYMKRPKSDKPKMSMHDRAAQFAPFSALTGHKEAIDETARLVDDKIELSDDKKDELTYNFSVILKHINDLPMVKVEYFVPDELKKGGKYVTMIDNLIKYDSYKDMLVFQNNKCINMNDIIEIEYIKPENK